MNAVLVPELYVTNLAESLRFYAAFGFAIRYDRPAEHFAYLERGGAELMLDEPHGRVWLTSSLERPFGRGINLQITVEDAEALFAVRPVTTPVILPCETRNYERLQDLITVCQFVVADPDGYLLRFSQILDVSPMPLPAMP